MPEKDILHCGIFAVIVGMVTRGIFMLHTVLSIMQQNVFQCTYGAVFIEAVKLKLTWHFIHSLQIIFFSIFSLLIIQTNTDYDHSKIT